MKALLVVDIEETNLNECEVSYVIQDRNGTVLDTDTGAKLQPMPNEREEKERVDFYDMGWNDCVRVLNNDYNLCKLG